MKKMNYYKPFDPHKDDYEYICKPENKTECENCNFVCEHNPNPLLKP